MADDWTSVDSPSGHARWLHYDRKLALRVRPVGGNRYSVALQRAARYGPGSVDEPPDVYVTVVRGMQAAAERVRWIKDNVDRLLRGEVMARDRAEGDEAEMEAELDD